MSSLIDRVADLLYPEDGPTTVDIKFFCAGETVRTAEQIAGQVHQALISVENGSSDKVVDFSGY